MSSTRCSSRWRDTTSFAAARCIPTLTADDYAHVIIACLAHDIGYVRGLFKDDDADGFVIDVDRQRK